MFDTNEINSVYKELSRCSISISNPEEFEVINIHMPDNMSGQINYLLYDKVVVITGTTGDGLFKLEKRATLHEISGYDMNSLLDTAVSGTRDEMLQFCGKQAVSYLTNYMESHTFCESDKSLVRANLLPFLSESKTRKEAETVWESFIKFPLLQSYRFRTSELMEEVMGAGQEFTHNAYLWYVGLKLAYDMEQMGV